MQQNENQRLKFLRAKHGHSQKDVADVLDMTQAGYSALEKGKINLSRTHLQLLKDKLNYNVDYILEGNEFENASPGDSLTELKNENKTLKAQVSELLSMVRDLTNSVNMLSQKLGKHKGNPNNYTGKEVPFMSVSVTPLAKVG